MLYLGVALCGAVVERESDANFLPVNDADTVLRVVLALAMIALGVLASAWAEAGLCPDRQVSG